MAEKCHDHHIGGSDSKSHLKMAMEHMKSEHKDPHGEERPGQGFGGAYRHRGEPTKSED